MGVLSRALPYVDDVIRRADDILPFLAILFGMVPKFVGIVSVIGAGLVARQRASLTAKRIAGLVAIIGGLWTAYNWFGWPFVIHESASEFSFGRLIGMAFFGAAAAMICELIVEAERVKQDVSPTESLRGGASF